jgi:hypothetical protein
MAASLGGGGAGRRASGRWEKKPYVVGVASCRGQRAASSARGKRRKRWGASVEEGFHESNHGSMAPAPRGLEIAFFFFFFYYYCSYSTGTPD